MQKGASKREAEKSVLQRTTQQTWCRQQVWTFNLGIHYATKHGGCSGPDYEKARTFDKNIAKEKASYGRESPDRRTTQAVLKETKSTLLE